jgi:hypothetical protein
MNYFTIYRYIHFQFIPTFLPTFLGKIVSIIMRLIYYKCKIQTMYSDIYISYKYGVDRKYIFIIICSKKDNYL